MNHAFFHEDLNHAFFQPELYVLHYSTSLEISGKIHWRIAIIIVIVTSTYDKHCSGSLSVSYAL